MFEFTVKAHRPKTNAADVKSEVVPIKASVTVKFGAGKENPTPYNGAETHCVSTNTLPAKLFKIINDFVVTYRTCYTALPYTVKFI